MTRAVCTVAASAALVLAFAHGTVGSTGRHPQATAMAPHSAMKHSPLQQPAPAFSPRDRLVICDYFRNISSRLPPGLRIRNGDLPQGFEEQLQRNGRLPNGLDKRVDPFPRELIGLLDPLPLDYTRGLIGGTAVLIDQRTGMIVDMIPDLFVAATR